MATETVTRFDVGGRLRKPRRDGRGFLRADGHATRAGVFEYRNPDGTIRRELRLPEDVQAPASLATYDGAAFTHQHPPEMVGPANARQYQAGTIMGEGRRDGDHVAVTILVTDGAAIKALEDGKARQLSVGYTVDLEKTAGEHPTYGRYDAIQRNIVVNHVALVEQARAGETACVRMDGADAPTAQWEDTGEPEHATCVPSETRYNHDHKQGTDHMADPQKNDNSATVDTLTQQLAAANARADKAEGERDALKTERDSEKVRADKAEGERDALKSERTDAATKVTELTAQVATLTSERDAEKVRADAAEAPERLEIRIAAMQVIGADVKFDGKDDNAIMTEVIAKLQPDVPLGDKPTAAYVKARFDVAYEGYKKNAGQLGKAREIASDNAAPRVDAKTARAKMIESNLAASQKAKE